MADYLLFCGPALSKAGVSAVALEGALNEIGRLDGGTVESYPEDATGRKVSKSFLYNWAISMFEHLGFERTRQIGKNHWVVRKVVESLVQVMV